MRRPSKALPLAVAALATAVALAGCGSSSKKTSTAANTTPTTAATNKVATGPALGIAGFAYQPEPLTVAAGATVTTTDSDKAAHTVTSDTAGLFDANVEKGTPVTFTAPAKAGTYKYHCAYHPNMHGTLIVKP